MRESLSLALLSFALAAPAPAQEPALVERAGRHFRIVLHPGELPAELAQRFADEAVAAAEATWSTAQKLLPTKPKGSTIHLYAVESEFRAVEKKHRRPHPVEAIVASPLEGHVLIWPVLSPTCLAEIGLPIPVARELQLVAIQQMASPSVPATDEHHWLRELVALGILETVVNGKRRTGVDLDYDSRRARLRRWTEPPQSAVRIDQITRAELPTTRDEADGRRVQLAVLAELLAATDRNGWVKKVLGKQNEAAHDHGHGVNHLQRRYLAVHSVLGSASKANEAFAKVQGAIEARHDVIAPLVQRNGDRWLFASGKGGWAMLLQRGVLPKQGDCVVRMRGEGIESAPTVVIDLGDADQNQVRVKIARGALTVATTGRDTEETLRSTGQVELARQWELRVEIRGTEVAASVPGGEPVVWNFGARDVRTDLTVSVSGESWIDAIEVVPAPK